MGSCVGGGGADDGANMFGEGLKKVPVYDGGAQGGGKLEDGLRSVPGGLAGVFRCVCCMLLKQGDEVGQEGCVDSVGDTLYEGRGGSVDDVVDEGG